MRCLGYVDEGSHRLLASGDGLQVAIATMARTRCADVIYVVRYLLIAIYTVIWSSICVLLAVVDRSGEGTLWGALQWIRWILWTCGVEVASKGSERVLQGRPCIWMSNHQSVFDIAAIMYTLPKGASFRFVAKRELTWIPFFGWALVAGGHVILDRRDRVRSIESLKRAAVRVAAGTSVIVFPEGTRSTSGVLGEFKSGGFHLAMEAGVPIVPISVSGSNRITPKGSLRIESGRLKVHYGEPIETADLDLAGRNQLKESVREAIAKGYDAGF